MCIELLLKFSPNHHPIVIKTPLSLLNPEKETKKKTRFFSQYKGDQINQLQPNAAVGFRTASPVIYPKLKIQKDGAFLSGSGPVARVGGCGYGSVRE